jgi:hypothetical protein
MPKGPSQNPQASPEQIVYATVLEKCMYAGLALLLLTFALYTLGIVRPYIPLGEVSNYWSHGVTEYLHMTDIEAGWSWIRMLRYGDFLNYVPIAILAGTTVVCYLAIVPTLVRRKDKTYAILALLEAVILSVAASGVLGTGGH